MKTMQLIVCKIVKLIFKNRQNSIKFPKKFVTKHALKILEFQHFHRSLQSI